MSSSPTAPTTTPTTPAAAPTTTPTTTPTVIPTTTPTTPAAAPTTTPPNHSNHNTPTTPTVIPTTIPASSPSDYYQWIHDPQTSTLDLLRDPAKGKLYRNFNWDKYDYPDTINPATNKPGPNNELAKQMARDLTKVVPEHRVTVGKTAVMCVKGCEKVDPCYTREYKTIRMDCGHTLVLLKCNHVQAQQDPKA